MDANTGSAISGFDFSVDESGVGDVSFDLTSLVGSFLGLQFELGSYDAFFDSTLIVSNVMIVAGDVVPVPEPSTPVLFSLGLFALWYSRKTVRKK